jgi:hypothetical protein
MPVFFTYARDLSLLDANSSAHKVERLPLPSRFPVDASPCLTVSPATGHAFLWSPSTKTVWEYDDRGRRISEMQLANAPELVQSIGMSHGREAIAVWMGGGTWGLMKKSPTGSWSAGSSFCVSDTQAHVILVISTSADGTDERCLHRHIIRCKSGRRVCDCRDGQRHRGRPGGRDSVRHV